MRGRVKIKKYLIIFVLDCSCQTPDEEVAGRNSSGNPFIFHNQEVPFDNPNIEKNNINNYSVISRMKGSEYQSRIDVPTVDLNLRQQQTFELQLREL